MDLLYPLAKYVHLFALFVAAGVTAVTKLAAGRRMRARTVGEALDWHNVLLSAAKLFPICLVVLAITGGTGRFRDASGTMNLHALAGGTKFAFRFHVRRGR